ncbi:hypothetical protein CVT26_015380 [Gymnopilus dilepis]|uniref:Uncharacterized protein n=1 Tax=Gymnopilus dilepis TaxID=231916 RepID=A0A409WD26_9AGAR|nr:hypothetical protein CVT26_015380 [Gymnopilus dilepis]
MIYPGSQNVPRYRAADNIELVPEQWVLEPPDATNTANAKKTYDSMLKLESVPSIWISWLLRINPDCEQ